MRPTLPRSLPFPSTKAAASLVNWYHVKRSKGYIWWVDVFFARLSLALLLVFTFGGWSVEVPLYRNIMWPVMLVIFYIGSKQAMTRRWYTAAMWGHLLFRYCGEHTN